jgi:ABC-2 type transport system permease protein
MRQAFLALVMLWSQDNELLETVRSGNAAYEFCRPLSVYSFWFARLLALRFSRTLLRCFPILIIAFFLPEPYRFHLPPSAQSLLLFLPALFFAALLVVVISMFIYLLTFYTLNSTGSRLIVGVTGEFFMGALIPIPLMPLSLQHFLNWLPFRYTADFPFRVYSGSIAGAEALWGLLIQVLWIVGLAAVGAWGFRQAQRRIVLQGG